MTRRNWPVWLVLGVLVLGLGAAGKQPCLDRGYNTDAIAIKQCYSDIPVFYATRGLAGTFTPFGGEDTRFVSLEYPPLTNLHIELSAWLTHVVHGLNAADLRQRDDTPVADYPGRPGVVEEESTFFWVSALTLGLVGLAALITLSRLRPPIRPLHFMIVAPLVVLTAFVNWDLIPLLLISLALLAWERGRPGWFGVWVGLGTAAKLFPILMLAGALPILLARRDWRGMTYAVAGATLSWVAVNLPAMVLHPAAWLTFWQANADRVADFGSGWMALRMLGHHVDGPTIHVLHLAAMVIALAALALGVLTQRLAPDLAVLSLVLVFAFVAANQVYSPQYALWLLPFVIVAVRQWWLLTIWVVAEMFYYVEIWLYITGITTPDVGVDKVYLLSIAIRLVAEALVVVMVLRAAYRRTTSQVGSDSAVPALD